MQLRADVIATVLVVPIYVVSEIRLGLINLPVCTLTWRTILPNFIPIRSETTEPTAF